MFNRKLREEMLNAEQRATTYARKLNQIESIIKVGQIQKTPSVFIVDKIKEALTSDLN
jgi:hypothetical protein